MARLISTEAWWHLVSRRAPCRSLLQLDSEPLSHPIERPAVDTKNLGGTGPIPIRGVEHVQEVPAFEVVECRQI